MNTVISEFFRLTGQNKISKTKRERGLSVGRKLREDGFSLEDIAFAVEWTIENSEKEPYEFASFAIIEHTIGQALAARDKIESARRERKKLDRLKEEEILARESVDQDRQEIEAYKASRSQEERTELRKQAETEFSESMVKLARTMNPIPNFQRDLWIAIDIRNLQIHLPECTAEVLQEKN